MKKILIIFIFFLQATYGLDISENKELYEDCNKGNMESCFEFAEIYHGGVYNGTYEEIYYTVAIEPYKKACKKENPRACVKLGLMYRAARGVDLNIRESFRYYQKACDMDYRYACFKLGFLYKIKGCPQKALVLYEKACSLKSSRACERKDELLKLIKNKIIEECQF